MKLSSNDYALLVSLYESDHYKALKRYFEARKIDVALSNMNSIDPIQIGLHKGMVAEIDNTMSQLQSLYKRHMNKGKK